jgi:hypothetical protein
MVKIAAASNKDQKRSKALTSFRTISVDPTCVRLHFVNRTYAGYPFFMTEAKPQNLMNPIRLRLSSLAAKEQSAGCWRINRKVLIGDLGMQSRVLGKKRAKKFYSLQVRL